MKGIHLPWVFIALGVLMGNSPVMDLIGLAVGHLFFFLVYVIPKTKGTTLLRTPLFLYVSSTQRHSYLSPRVRVGHGAAQCTAAACVSSCH